jgi:co-chaperonin GroES (HSP10)
MKEKIRPSRDFLLVKIIQPELKQGAIIMPTADEKFRRGIVLDVGPGLRDSQGDYMGVAFCADEKIIFPTYSGTAIAMTPSNQVDVILISADEVYGTFE